MTQAVVDTVVLRYFLLVDQAKLLFDLLGRPIYIPRVVFDPDEGSVPDALMSEVTRSMAFQQRRAGDTARTNRERQIATRNATRLSNLLPLIRAGEIAIAELTPDEQAVFAQLVDSENELVPGRALPLGRGEAACIALALSRGWVFVTDDGDAIKALKALRPKHPHERIRRLLARAANSGLCTAREANAIHAEMVGLGFWDKSAPLASD